MGEQQSSAETAAATRSGGGDGDGSADDHPPDSQPQPPETATTSSIQPKYVYYTLAALFLLLTIGPGAVVILLAVALALLIGFIGCLVYEGYGHRAKIKRQFDQWRQQFRFSQGLPFAIRESQGDPAMYSEQPKSMTSSELLDPILEQILENIMRDNVDSWYSELTSDKLFQASLKRTTRRTVIAFRTCLSKVDWLPLLTRHLVDDFASHLRLYRKAKERVGQVATGTGARSTPTDDLESLFFDLELEMEKNYCRDLISTSPAYESAYLHDICDILLYLLMPSEDFRCRPLRFLVREVLVNRVLIPVVDRLAEPSFINRSIVWLLSELPVNTDDFVQSLDMCRYIQELEAILECMHEEENAIRSKGGGGPGAVQGNIFTAQLTSLDFGKELIRRRMMRLAKMEQKQQQQASQGDETGTAAMAPSGLAWRGGREEAMAMPVEMAEDAAAIYEAGRPEAVAIPHLPFTLVLTHPVALTHFIEYLKEVGGQNYIDFYLAIEGFKNSMEHQLRAQALERASRGSNSRSGAILDADVRETLREAALFMYHQYLSHEAITRVPLGDGIINKFLARLRNDVPSDCWFEEIQGKVVDTLRTDERFYPAFKRHGIYLKLLEELGLAQAGNNGRSVEEDEDDVDEEAASLLEEIIQEGEQLEAEEEDELDEDDQRPTSSSSSSVPGAKRPSEVEERNSSRNGGTGTKSAPIPGTGDQPSTTVLVEMLGLGHQGRHLFALYNIRVTRADSRGGSSSNVIRRYSDFHALHNLVHAKYPNLRTLPFPGKKTFNNLDRDFLDRRCQALNQYMNCLLQPALFEANAGLEPIVFDFLSQKRYTARSRGSMHRANAGANTNNAGDSLPRATIVGTVFNPLMSGMRAFGNAAVAMPSELMDGIGRVGSEFNRAASSVLKQASNPARQNSSRTGSLSSNSNGNFNTSSAPSLASMATDTNSRVGAQIDENDSAESIPLRLLLLLVDEVFGLREKNQWFRRRLVSLLRQFVHATLGNSINRRIVDAVNWLTSEEQVAQYLIALRDYVWDEQQQQQEQAGGSQRDSLLKTRFMARCLMLSAVPEQLRLFIGAQTMHAGVENVSEALQNRHLNRRFWYVIFERLLVTVFPNNRFDRLLPQLHAKSPRKQMA